MSPSRQRGWRGSAARAHARGRRTPPAARTPGPPPRRAGATAKNSGSPRARRTRRSTQPVCSLPEGQQRSPPCRQAGALPGEAAPAAARSPRTRRSARRGPCRARTDRGRAAATACRGRAPDHPGLQAAQHDLVRHARREQAGERHELGSHHAGPAPPRGRRIPSAQIGGTRRRPPPRTASKPADPAERRLGRVDLAEAVIGEEAGQREDLAGVELDDRDHREGQPVRGDDAQEAAPCVARSRGAPRRPGRQARMAGRAGTRRSGRRSPRPRRVGPRTGAATRRRRPRQEGAVNADHRERGQGAQRVEQGEARGSRVHAGRG